jgi:2-dehydro-3-deoxygluconokinase
LKNKNAVLFIGEAMLELVNKSDTTIAKSFAGDVYNSGVYMKRAYPNISCGFMSAVGQDLLSDEFIAKSQGESLDMSAVALSATHHLGIYMVVNDETGERSFIYWRNNSAAKSTISTLSSQQINDIESKYTNDGVLFFSGITLAILHPNERVLFWDLVSKMQEAGSLIVFDPNYRPQLWESIAVAKQETEKAFAVSDWLMPGLDDFKALYGHTTVQECLDFCAQFTFAELILKQGEKSVHVINDDGHNEFEIVKSKNVVDTTSAGDAFNGVYLGSRFSGLTPKMSTQLANYAASKVIETPGAIMPAPLFKECWANKPA